MNNTKSDPDSQTLSPVLARIADALERIAPPAPSQDNLDAFSAFVWDGNAGALQGVEHINRIPIALLKGIDHAASLLLNNTQQFARGFPANNVLLWGARGMGKSSLVKSVHKAVCDTEADTLKLIEIHREDINTLPVLLSRIAHKPLRFIVFCDDLSFDDGDTSYKSLKAVLEGGLQGRPSNVLFYATSNRRHLLPRDMVENERATAINPGEAVEEKVSLSDRFGLWIGFHNCDQNTYLSMIFSYLDHAGIIADEDRDQVRADALEWSITRGARSGRVAWQFVQDYAGRKEKTLDL